MTDPRPQKMWAVYSYGSLVVVARTRRDAVRDAEGWYGESWVDLRDHLQVRKVLVTVR